MIVHNGIDIPSFDERWERNESRFINMAWDNVLNGRTIVSSTWTVPAGWTKGTEQTSQSVTDEDGTEWSATNRVYLSTIHSRGVYKITNTVVLSGASPGEKLVRSVYIHIAGL